MPSDKHTSIPTQQGKQPKVISQDIKEETQLKYNARLGRCVFAAMSTMTPTYQQLRCPLVRCDYNDLTPGDFPSNCSAT
jgi:hypothetical protein